MGIFSPYNLNSESTDTDPALTPRAWWRSTDDKTRVAGVEKSLEMLKDVLRKDHYEGVFGFRCALTCYRRRDVDVPLHLIPSSN